MAARETSFDELVLDTLFERRLRRQGCFVDNQAGEELIASPTAAIPAIESVVRDTLEPAISVGTVIARAFHGLDYVLGAYLVISAKTDPERAVQFLSGTSVALQVEALAAMRTFFQTMRDGYNCGVAPPAQFRAFVRELARSEVDELRLAAERTLKFVTWAP